MSDIIKSIVSVLISCVKDTSRYTLACGGVDSMIAWYGKKIGAQSAIHAFDVGLAKAAKYVGNPVAFVHAKSGFGGVVQLSACGTFYKRNDIGLGLRIAKDANEAESFKGKDVYGLVSTLTDVLKLKAYPLPINANGEYHGVVYTVR